MKTAISLPDAIFHEAERHARREGKTRSEIYKLALAEYLARHAADKVAEALDRVWGELGERPEPFLDAASRRTLERSEW